MFTKENGNLFHYSKFEVFVQKGAVLHYCNWSCTFLNSCTSQLNLQYQ
jgi:hypothetical protein